MRKTKVVSILSAFAVLVTGMTASAALVTMNFTGTEGNNSGGTYTYPYYFTINSVNYLLMCDDYNHMTSPPETWTANTLDVTDLNGSNVLNLNFPGAGVTGYLEASYLFEEEVDAYDASNSDSDGLYNWAVWDLLTNSDISGAHLDSGQETQVQIYLDDAEALGGTLTPSDFPDMVIYTPTDMSGGGPQEFFGYVPEPSTVALLGIGTVGLLGRRRKRTVHGAAHSTPI